VFQNWLQSYKNQEKYKRKVRFSFHFQGQSKFGEAKGMKVGNTKNFVFLLKFKIIM